MPNNSLLSRVIDTGKELYSDDFSIITCHLCETLISPMCEVKSCPCGKQLVCVKCAKIDFFMCDVCNEYTYDATEPIGQLQKTIISSVKLRCIHSNQCTDSITLSNVIQHDTKTCKFRPETRNVKCPFCLEECKNPSLHLCEQDQLFCNNHLNSPIIPDRIVKEDESAVKLFEILKCSLCEGLIQNGIQCVTCETISCQ